jgi:hypothetical protein
MASPAVMAALVERAVMRCLPTEMAAQAVWAVTPVMAVTVVRVLMVLMR